MAKSSTVHEPRPGDQLGDFRILHLLGEGAMGKVYEARQLSLQRRVAVKVLPAEGGAADKQAVTRFYREARAAAQLQHPSIVPVYDFGYEQGCYYYAMQYVAGRSLADAIHEDGVRDMKRIATWILNVSRALESAHAQSVIHRDVKPPNIMIREEDDEALITDFGLARQEKVRAITQVGALIGTPVYMAPEQARGEPATPSVDTYALGATLYEALAGHVAFRSDNLRDLLIQITTKPPRPPSMEHSDVPSDLEAIALKAMAKLPSERYLSAGDMSEDLLRYLRGDEVLARGGNQAQRLWRALERKPLVGALMAAQAISLIVILVLLALPGGGGSDDAQSQLNAAKVSVGDDLEQWRLARTALAQALAARDRARRDVGGTTPTQTFVSNARASLREVELRLTSAGSGGSLSPAAAALSQARTALAIAPAGDELRAEARALVGDLLVLLRDHSRARGADLRVASLRAEIAALSAGQAAQQDASPTPEPASLKVLSQPSGAEVRLSVLSHDEFGWTLREAQLLGKTPVTRPGLLEAGQTYLLELRAAGCFPVRLPIEVALDRSDLGTPEGLEVVRDLQLPQTAGLPAGFVYVPAGELRFGTDHHALRPLFPSPEPVWVQGVFLAAQELTVAEYREFLTSRTPQQRRLHRPLSGQFDAQGEVTGELATHPVAGVSYASALAYCAWRSQLTGLTFRLPTEQEWERAARGIARNVFPWGARPPKPSAELANFHRHARPAPTTPTAPVRSHPRDQSLFGLYDLGGNVSEWVDGGFGGDPRFRVLRGGSWERGPEQVRSTSREAVDPRTGFPAISDRVGLRLAIDPASVPKR